MLTLALLRHAKSSWDDPDLDDFERPLAKRGIGDAPRLGAYLRRKSIVPGAILCSSAVRTRATVALLLAEWACTPPDIAYTDALYLASPETILETIRQRPPTEQSLLVVGHNPGLFGLALALTGAGDRKLIGALAAGFPTSALAVLTFDAPSFREIAAGRGTLTHFVTPRDLRD